MNVIINKIKKEVFDKFNDKCVICGLSQKYKTGNFSRLFIHHIDGDRKNNNPENLILVCRKCHKRIHLSEKRLGKQLMKTRNELILYLWNNKKAELTMEDIGKMFNLSNVQVYRIIKAGRIKNKK